MSKSIEAEACTRLIVTETYVFDPGLNPRVVMSKIDDDMGSSKNRFLTGLFNGFFELSKSIKSASRPRTRLILSQITRV